MVESAMQANGAQPFSVLHNYRTYCQSEPLRSHLFLHFCIKEAFVTLFHIGVSYAAMLRMTWIEARTSADRTSLMLRRHAKDDTLTTSSLNNTCGGVIELFRQARHSRHYHHLERSQVCMLRLKLNVEYAFMCVRC